MFSLDFVQSHDANRLLFLAQAGYRKVLLGISYNEGFNVLFR